MSPKAFLDWLDHRTGSRRLAREVLCENVPGGARWRYVWGSTLTFTLAVQFITGLCLWMAYSPSSQTAWESVYYIQHEMTGGWLLRGIHHYTAQAMNVLLVLHLLQVLIDGAYKAPRELNFWFGLGLLFLVMGLSLTGYLLPWDQKGYWATKVATSIAAVTPFAGPEIQKLIVGGAEYGHHTLTRFFALHAGVLPAAIVGLVVLHIYLFRRHGLTAKEPRRRPDEPFWPGQVLKDAIACLAVMAAVLLLTVRSHGAGLAAPADPAENFSAARPEWYFLFLFQFLKYQEPLFGWLPGSAEVWAAMIAPGLAVAVVAAMPLLGRWRLGHRFNVAFTLGLLLAAGLLTWRALAEDAANPRYQASVRQADRDARRAVELARAPAGIPGTGAITLLRQDPFTQGPRLFARHCASCHRYDGHDGLGQPPADPASAPDLAGFASRRWLEGLLDPAGFTSSNYFGGTKHADGKMARFLRKDVAAFDAAGKEQLRKVVLALSAEAGLKAQQADDRRDAALIEEGRRLAANDTMRCTECHAFHSDEEDATAPVLTGYGSRDWLIGIIRHPAHERFYGRRNDRMPLFGQDRILDDAAIGILADWLRGDWYTPGPTASPKP
jgi:ubiquinol-cytochrome c reductase cytochrome b subunit